MTYKTKYVPVDLVRVVCGDAEIEQSFKDPVELSSAYIPNVQTDDDVELLAKAALDDVLSLDTAHQDLAAEADKLEARCAREKEAAEAERQSTLESINELNKS